ncbi:alkaline phosphatase family protein [Streptomyces sp. AP-93]|uniref:alkaline phosphatase family protein n=1 Tax=Streptomyces sp. AP-93 TaxID=2929048 RepID=UPI001FAFA5B7|nr:alkaline phosphatase family protein [Streptomyces sp. AP-93]MCJ0873515.1 alkaline phosphatase family protein [Streptomyces sp. AP-93]
MTVYWVVWDAGAHWIVDRLEREGALPALSRMRERGVFAAARPAHPNCQTPPSLATLFTGTWPSEHKVTGYTVPGAGEGIASHVSGFSPGFPAVALVWEALSEHDLTSALVHAPWVFGHDGQVGPHIKGAVEAYSRRSTRHAVRVLDPGSGIQEWQIGAFRVEAVVESSSGSAAEAEPSGLVRVRVRPGGTRAGAGLADRHTDGLLLGAGAGWQPLWLDRDHGTWVACVPVDGRLLLVHTGVWQTRTGGRNPKTLHRLALCPPFAGEGVGPLYREGVFGPRLAEGGDGSAEEVFLSSVECVARSFGAAADAVLETHDADLVVVYLPMTDDVGHELLGWCDERSAAYRPDIAESVWSYVRRCYQWSDAVLGRVLDRADEDDSVVLGADHGMVGSTHLVHLNDQLVRSGLACTHADGSLDTDRSEVFYHPANNGSLWVGPGPAADPERARAAMERACAGLGSLTDPDTGRPVVAGFLHRDGERAADPAADPAVVYVALADDYQPTAQLLGEGPVVRRVPKTGAHVVYTGDSRLHAVHAAVGPGIAAGVDAGVIDNTHPAALVLGQLGLGRAAPGPYSTSTSEPTDER